MTVEQIVSLIQHIKDAGLSVEKTPVNWRIKSEGGTCLGEVASLEALQGWFACWREHA